MAQILKVPLEYFRSKQTNWVLMAGTTYGADLFVGFDSSVFAVFSIMMIVTYDATGVRRQAFMLRRSIC